LARNRTNENGKDLLTSQLYNRKGGEKDALIHDITGRKARSQIAEYGKGRLESNQYSGEGEGKKSGSFSFVIGKVRRHALTNRTAKGKPDPQSLVEKKNSALQILNYPRRRKKKGRASYALFIAYGGRGEGEFQSKDRLTYIMKRVSWTKDRRDGGKEGRSISLLGKKKGTKKGAHEIRKKSWRGSVHPGVKKKKEFPRDRSGAADRKRETPLSTSTGE